MDYLAPLNSLSYITMFMLALTLAPSTQATASNDLDAGSLEIKAGAISFPPFFIVNKNQPLSGIYFDIMEKTLQHAKLKYRIDVYPTKRLYRNLRNGKTELFIGIKGSPEYDKHVLYSTFEISQIQMRAYTIGDTPLPNRKEDIKNCKIITLRGYSYGGLINYFNDPENNINITSTSSHRSSFLMLKDHRADYVINYKHPSNEALKNLEIPDLKYSNLYNAKIYFIVSKALPNAENILKTLEKSYIELLELGELTYIENDD